MTSEPEEAPTEVDDFLDVESLEADQPPSVGSLHQQVQEGLPISPFKAIRSQANISLRELAKKLNCGYQMLYLTEKACYPNIPPVVRNWIKQEAGVLDDELTIGHIDSLYNLYQLETRQIFGAKHGLHLIARVPVRRQRLVVATPSTTPVGAYRITESPLLTFVQYLGLSKTHFIKELCIQPAVFYKLEQNLTGTIPKQILEALHQAGLKLELVRQLAEYTQEYFRQEKSKRW